MPRVSVIIPTFNRAGYLREAIASVLAQSYRDFELIVSDSASSDETPEVVGAFADPRVRYVRHDTWVRVTENWRLGLAQARGEFAVFHHDDNRWEPALLEKCVAALEAHPEAVLAFTDRWIVTAASEIDEQETREDGLVTGRDRLAAGLHRPFLELHVGQVAIPPDGTAFRLGVVPVDRLIDLRADTAGDLWIYYQLALTGLGAWYIPERLQYFRRHPSSVSRTQGTDVGALWCYGQFAADPTLAALHPGLRADLATAELIHGKELLAHGRSREARAYLRAAMGHGGQGGRYLLPYLAAWLPGPLARLALRLASRGRNPP